MGEIRREGVDWPPRERRRFSRRKVLKGLGLAGVALVGASGLGAVVVTAFERNFRRGDYSGFGEEIDGKVKRFITEGVLDREEIPVRSSWSQSDKAIIGWTKPGLSVEAIGRWGPLYSSSPLGVGKTLRNGRYYGRWYELRQEVPLFKKTVQGLVPDLDENGQQKKSLGFLGGNFLRLATKEELAASK